MKNIDALQDLVGKGFIPARTPGGDGAEELISSDGEVIATMKNGTEYVLRFGKFTNVGAGDKANEDTATGEPNAADAKANDGGVHRYLFVMARFNENAVKRPDLQDLPELPAKDEQPAAAQPPASEPVDANEAATSSDSAATGESPTDPAADAAATSDPAGTSADDNASAPADASPADAAAQEQQEEEEEEEEAAEEGAAVEKAANSDSDLASTETSSDSPAAATEDASATDTTTADATETTSDPPAAEGGTTSAASDGDKGLEKIIADRKRIEQENQRKLDEYQESLEKGRDNVKELNLRFGDWYFVVADDVFKKIRLSRQDVIKKKEKKDDDAKADSASGTTSDAVPPGGAIPGLPTIPGADQ
jgi:hypothetical protein